jgi:hypothetical protein
MKLPELEVGDIALVGKFKNRKATIEGFGTDKNNQPTIKTDLGEFPVFKIRLQKLMASLKVGDSTVVEAGDEWLLESFGMGEKIGEARSHGHKNLADQLIVHYQKWLAKKPKDRLQEIKKSFDDGVRVGLGNV